MPSMVEGAESAEQDRMPTGVRLGVAIMYHPSRAVSACKVADDCSPLAPRLVPDPDPGGPPSPLRTARRAWAACVPGATHHLVLQDDVLLAEGFVERVLQAVAARPAHAIALYVNQASKHNGFRFRRAAARGDRWAALSRFEYTPTLGLILPVTAARALARHLEGVPDEFGDDDEVVTVFRRRRGIPAVAVVPALVEHGDLPSVAGNDAHGSRHAVAFGDRVGAEDEDHLVDDAEDSIQEGVLEDVLSGANEDPDYAIEVLDSRCVIRFLRPESGEPIDNPYGWDWYDWCGLLDVSAEKVLDSWADHATLAPPPVGVASATMLELWAAGYLTGCGAATMRGSRSAVTRVAVETWVDCGLRPQEQERLTPAARTALVEVCLAGIRAAATAAVAPVAPVAPVASAAGR